MTEHHLYDGEICLEFDEGAHEYFVGDRRVPNVTSIVDVIENPHLAKWRLNEALKYLSLNIAPGTEYDEIDIALLLKYAATEHIEISDRAKNIGTLVHKWIENYIEHLANPEVAEPDLPVNKDALIGCTTFKTWLSKQDIEFLASERKIYSKKHNYTGTLDAIGKIEGKLYVIDFKTSKRLYPEHGIQTAAYAKAYEEETGEKIQGLRIIRIPKERTLVRPRCTFKDYTNINSLFKTFLSCLDIYHWKNS